MWRRYENETHIVYETIYYVYYASASTKTWSLMMLSGIEAKVVLNRVELLTGVLSTMRIILGNETLSVNETEVVIYTKRVDTDPGTHVYHVPVYISDNVSMCGFVSPQPRIQA